MAARQYGNPMLIENDIEKRLERVRADELGKTEDWLQELLFKHPGLLPIDEIEPAFSGPISVARELRTRSGPVDLLCVNGRGHITLIETKLWKNPEDRRMVVGQIIDYAAQIAKWSYSDLVSAVRTATGSTEADPLMAAVRAIAPEEFDDSEFTDTVSKNLARGRFLLLIVGDGIQEGVEHMAEFLQCAPHLGFTLGLIELALFRSGDDSKAGFFVQPRVVARTREITRAVVEIHSSVPAVAVTVTVPEAQSETSKSSSGARKHLSEELFLEELIKEAGADVANLVRQTIAEGREHGLEVDYKFVAGPILKYVDEDTGEFFNFGQFTRYGTLGSSQRLSEKCVRLGLPEKIWKDYYAGVVPLIPGSREVPLKEKGTEGVFAGLFTVDRDDPPLEPLLKNRNQWFAAVDTAIAAIRKSLVRRM